MNDTQILTLAISVIVPVSFLLLSNSRISDVKETLRADIQSAKSELRTEMQVTRGDIQTVKSEMQTMKAEILNRLDRFEDNITRLVAVHDQRIAKLEAGRS